MTPERRGIIFLLKDLDVGRQFISEILSETLGTAYIMAIGCTDPTPIRFAIVISAVVAIFGPTSGGLCNPGLNLSAFILGRLNFFKLCTYTASQILGAYLGIILLEYLHPNANSCLSTPNQNLTTFVSECFYSGFVSLAFCRVFDTDKPSKVGFIMFFFAIYSIASTGATVNPARAIGPAIFQGVWDGQWVYWLADCVGYSVFAFFYRCFFDRTPLIQETFLFQIY